MTITKDIWIGTYTGRNINLKEFCSDDIDLRDVAISLSRQRRYAGHSAVPWTVGQHTLLCGMMAQMAGASDIDTQAVVLHDFEETWIQDIIFPIKTTMVLGQYKELCSNVSNVVYDFFGLPDFLSDSNNVHMIKTFDQAAFIIEAFHLLPGFVHNQNLFHNDVNVLVAKLIENDFSIPKELIDMSDEDVAQELFEIMNVWKLENSLGQPISTDNQEGQ